MKYVKKLLMVARKRFSSCRLPWFSLVGRRDGVLFPRQMGYQTRLPGLDPRPLRMELRLEVGHFRRIDNFGFLSALERSSIHRGPRSCSKPRPVPADVTAIERCSTSSLCRQFPPKRAFFSRSSAGVLGCKCFSFCCSGNAFIRDDDLRVNYLFVVDERIAPGPFRRCSLFNILFACS